MFWKKVNKSILSEEEFKILIRSIEDFFLVLDSEKRIVAFYQPQDFEKFFIWSEEYIGKSYKEACFDEIIISKIEGEIKKITTKNSIYKSSFSLDLAGNTFWFAANFVRRVDKNGNFNGFIITAKNITDDRKERMELELQVEELENIKKAIFNLLEDMEEERKNSIQLAKDLEKFKLAVALSSDHIQITNPDQILVYMNEAAEKITGYTQKESLGKKIAGLWRNMSKSVYKDFWHTIHNEKKPFIGEIINRRKNGEEYPAAVQVFPLLDKKGEIIFFVGIERDITKSKEVDKMKSEFISLASHQLRTPLSGIKWLTEILLGDKVGSLSTDQREFLSQIKESNERMIKLVNDLLDISHIETGEKFSISKSDCDFVEILNTVIHEQKILAEKKSLKFRYLHELPSKLIIKVDGEKVMQVIANFVSNAIKYSNPETEIIIDLNVTNEITFMVRNVGILINSDEEKNIFGKFYRTNLAKSTDPGGSGLGLYIAKAIVEGHGGKIWFTSKEGEGTSFYFSLPKN